jgi:hypothetical protein
MARTLEPAPAALVNEGQITFGVFDTPVRNVNIQDAEQYRGAGRLRLKQWLGFAIEHPDWHMCVFLLHAGYLSSATVYAYHKPTRRIVQYARVFPPGAPHLARNLYDDHCDFHAPGFSVIMHNHADRGFHTLCVRVPEKIGRPGLHMDLTLEEDLSRVTPLVASLPLTNNRTMFTHKAPMPLSGKARVGGERITFDPDRDVAIMDEHKSFLFGPVVWTWATCAGRAADGRLVGLNLGDHATIEDQEQWSENCLWAGDTLNLLGPAAFDFSPKHPARPWLIRDTQSRVNLTFFPHGRMDANHNLGPIRMNYCQMNGRFQGTAVDNFGKTIVIEDFPGVAETMDARF